MMAKFKPSSKVFVIDSSVSQAAGPEDAVHPTAKHCRDFLLAILSYCHRIAMTAPIADEWRSHRSGFSGQWLVSMHARKKVVFLDATHDASLDATFEQCKFSVKSLEALRKDAHLIEAALVADRRIASLDDTAKALFSVVAQDYKSISNICWVNPDRHFCDVVNWLTTGAQATSTWELGVS